jgi:hypothetical protein
LAFAYAATLAGHFESNLTTLHAFEYGPYSQTIEVLDQVPSKERKNAESLLRNFVLEAGHPDVSSEENKTGST